MSAEMPPPDPTASIGQSLIGNLAEADENERPLHFAYAIRFKGATEEEMAYHDAGMESLKGTLLTNAWGRRWLELADGTLVDPGEIAMLRSMTSAEAAEHEDAEEEETEFEAISALRRALEAVARSATRPATPASQPPQAAASGPVGLQAPSEPHL